MIEPIPLLIDFLVHKIKAGVSLQDLITEYQLTAEEVERIQRMHGWTLIYGTT